MYLEVIFQHPRLNSPINLQVFSHRCAQKDGWGYRWSWAAPSWPPLLANQLISCCHVGSREISWSAGATWGPEKSADQLLPRGQWAPHKIRWSDGATWALEKLADQLLAVAKWEPEGNELISCCHVDTRECQLAGMTRSEPYSQFQNLPAGCRGWSIPGNGANDMMEFVWCTSKWSKLQPWAFCRIERTIWGSIPRNSINDRMDILTGWNTSRRVQSIRWIFCRMEHR